MITLTIKDTVSNVIYAICEGIASVISYLFSFLPDNPFSDFSVPSEVSEVLGYVNWFLPVKQIILVIGLWLSAIIVIIISKLVLNFFQVIKG